MVFDAAEKCSNHPERVAVEHCEVCHAPLCAYCLYYTSDGQRLCKIHADQAEAAGAFIRAPGIYADGLVPAQVGATSKPPDKKAPLYEGNTPDVVALIGLLLSMVSVAMCIPGLGCMLGPIGLIASITALLGGKEAFNRKRTRTMAGIGIALSALWILIIAACLVLYFSQVAVVARSFNIIQVTVNAQVTAAVSTARVVPSPAATQRSPGISTAAAAPASTASPDESSTPPLGR